MKRTRTVSSRRGIAILIIPRRNHLRPGEILHELISGTPASNILQESDICFLLSRLVVNQFLLEISRHYPLRISNITQEYRKINKINSLILRQSSSSKAKLVLVFLMLKRTMDHLIQSLHFPVKVGFLEELLQIYHIW